MILYNNKAYLNQNDFSFIFILITVYPGSFFSKSIYICKLTLKDFKLFRRKLKRKKY